MQTRNCGIRNLNGIQNLTNLNILDLRTLYSGNTGSLTYDNFNDIADLSPLTPLTHLQNLYLSREIYDPSGQNRPGSITDIQPLTHLTDLTRLELQGNQISNIQPLSTLTNLSILYLGTLWTAGAGNTISDITPLSALTNLTQLDLTNNRVTDLSPLSGLTNLTSLIVGNVSGDASVNPVTCNKPDNRITSLAPIANLTNLTSITIANMGIGYDKAIPGYDSNKPGNRVTDLSPLTGPTNLVTVFLDGQQTLTDLSPLANLPNLKDLHATSNSVSSITSLEHLTNLKSLYLDSNHLGDTVFTTIQNMPNIKHLGLGDQITDISAITNLNLESLSLSGNHNISDWGLLAQNIGQFPNLTWLTLADDNIDTTAFNTIIQNGNFSNLQSLSMPNNQIDDVTAVRQNTTKFSNLVVFDVSSQNFQLPDKPDYDEHNPMSLGAATINSSASPAQYAQPNPDIASTPSKDQNYNANTGTMTWDKTMPGDYKFNFYHSSPMAFGNFIYSGTFSQHVPGHIVSFDPNGGSPAPDDQAHHTGELVAPPNRPTNADQLIEGWYNTATGTKWNFDTDTVTADITLQAHWIPAMTLPTAGSRPRLRMTGVALLLSSAVTGIELARRKWRCQLLR
ncbi:leucine-rich repeat domain-containing protein [Bombiscardovia apis]|uniref:leucine-rich repeat domain-containing protein n=1 Tax=Bombiscardovia apis TaxID=2932182 RepID=UPI002954B963|nr:leucine-rich repeat domain-containing protein [Bombiscardovia apis]